MAKEISEKKCITRRQIGNLFILAGILVITSLEWHVFELYQACTRYGTLITFVSLAGAFFCYVDIKDALKDKLFWLMALTDVIAAANLFIIGSNKGCILIVVDFMLILYLADKITFSRIESMAVIVYAAFFFFYWTVDVKGYFKGYNTNYGGLILITGFAFLMILMNIIYVSKIIDAKQCDNTRNHIKKPYKNAIDAKTKLYINTQDEIIKSGNSADNVADNLINNSNNTNVKSGKIGLNKRTIFVILFVFFVVLAFNIISWYRSRTALMGLLVLLAIMIIPGKIIFNKAVYTIITVAATAGSIAFSGLYIFLGKLGDGEGIQLFYKSVISGRNDIWGELWSAYLEHPITGIGSSYQMKLDYMQGMFEAHSAMMDILVVHGILVFIPLCGLLIYRLLKLRNILTFVEINNIKNISNENNTDSTNKDNDNIIDAEIRKYGTGKIIFAAIICILVTGFFENFYIVQPFSLLLLVLLSLPKYKNKK